MSRQQIDEMEILEAEELRKHLSLRRPFVMRGIHRDWEIVGKGKDSVEELKKFLNEKSLKRDFTFTVGEPGQNGRIFYNDKMQVNFSEQKAPFAKILDHFNRVEKQSEDVAIYLSSIDVKKYFQDLIEETPEYLTADSVRAGLWVGNRIRVPLHNDFPNNVACVVSGRRRFTLMPPEQLDNLYLGPIDYTPAGRSVSMVDHDRPDFDRFPKFQQALDEARVSVLEPGDALFIPSMWFHAVEGLDEFNVMLNFWWREDPVFLGGPDAAMMLAAATIRDLPHQEKLLWKQVFEYYVFDNKQESIEHIPEPSRGVLNRMTPALAGKIKSYLLEVLS